MTIKIISGGQSGADLGGLVAAERYGLIGEFGGWMPRGWLTEDGPKPEYEARFRMREHPSRDYRDRTISNIGLADATLIFGDPRTPGGRLATSTLLNLQLPYAVIGSSDYTKPAVLAREFIVRNNFTVINIAGNRESRDPGIQAWVERYLSEGFEVMGFKEIGR